MQRHHFKNYSAENTPLQKVVHKRVFSQVNQTSSMHSRPPFNVNDPISLSIKQSTQSGLLLLVDFIQMKQILNLKKAFQILESLKPHPDVFSFRKNRIESITHKRSDTSSSQKGLSRAHLIQDIISKLQSQGKANSKYAAEGSSPRVLFQESEVNRFDEILKPVNSARLLNISTNQSNIYNTKRSFIPRFHTKESEVQVEYSGKTNPKASYKVRDDAVREPMFKKLRNQITKVKSKCEKLSQMNEEYRRENQFLRMRSVDNFPCYRQICCHHYVVCPRSPPYTSKAQRENITCVSSPREGIAKCYNCGSHRVY